jgi:hypothetical protein
MRRSCAISNTACSFLPATHAGIHNVMIIPPEQGKRQAGIFAAAQNSPAAKTAGLFFLKREPKRNGAIYTSE